MNILGDTTHLTLIGILSVISLGFFVFVIYKAVTTPSPDAKSEIVGKAD